MPQSNVVADITRGHLVTVPPGATVAPSWGAVQGAGGEGINRSIPDLTGSMQEGNHRKNSGIDIKHPAKKTKKALNLAVGYAHKSWTPQWVLNKRVDLRPHSQEKKQQSCNTQRFRFPHFFTKKNKKLEK